MKSFIQKELILISAVSSTIIFCLSIFLLVTKGTSAGFSCIDVMAVFSIAILSALISIPVLLELSIKRSLLLILYIFHFVAINLYTLFLGYKLKWFILNSKKDLINIEIVIILIFLIALSGRYICISKNAKKMNERLAEIDLNYN